MKTNAIVRIVLFSIAIIVLLAILGAGLAFGLFMVNGDKLVTTANENHIVSSTENGSAAAEYDSQIRNIKIDWASGSITIQPDANASGITVVETFSEDNQYRMLCSQSGNTLTIKYSPDTLHWIGVSLGAEYSKDLVITVPADWTCNSLEIDAASANVNIHDLTISEVDFDGASGKCVFTNCSVEQFDVDTASGDIQFTGSLDVLDCDAASASCYLELANTPSRIDLDGVSGNLDVTLPNDCGFTCNMDSLSGRFSSDFAVTNQNGVHHYGDGSCRINVNGLSGDVIIRSSGAVEPAPACTDPTCTDRTHGHKETCTEPEHDHTEVHH